MFFLIDPLQSNPALIDNHVFLVQDDHVWPASFGFFGRKVAEIHDGQDVALLSQMSDRAVQDDLSLAAFTANGIGLKPVTIGQVAT